MENLSTLLIGLGLQAIVLVLSIRAAIGAKIRKEVQDAVRLENRLSVMETEVKNVANQFRNHVQKDE